MAVSQSQNVLSISSLPQEPVKVSVLSQADHEAWDEYAFRHSHGTPFHLIAWKKTIEESFHYKPYYLIARDDSVRGILPLFFIHNPVIGKALISSPFAVYGGILADSREAHRMLFDHAKALGERLRVDYIEFRNWSREQCVGEPNVSRYVAFHQELGMDEAALLASLPKKTRNMVRKSQKTPFISRYGQRNAAILDQVHARNMRRLGTPNFPRKYFDRLLANFNEMAEIREVWLRDVPVAVSLNLFFKNCMHTYHAAADTRYNALEPNTYMYFDHLRWASMSGYKVFDFGRSKRDTGAFHFKKHWNTTIRELPYQIVLVKRKSLPNFSPGNPRFSWAIHLWKHMPMPIARALSARILPMFP
jgi:FemAB-related protein (PEP-CTERM system-associated)